MFDISPIVLWVLGGAVVGAGIVWFLGWNAQWKGTWGNKRAFLKLFTESMCEVAEKLYSGSGRGKEKLAWVLGVLLAECEKKNISYDVAALTEIINSYVLRVLNAGKDLDGTKEVLEEKLV